MCCERGKVKVLLSLIVEVILGYGRLVQSGSGYEELFEKSPILLLGL